MECSFQYESIVGNDTIRVIEIRPGSSVDLIFCQIKSVRLSDKLPYEALSYCWGDPTFNKQIHCNGQKLAITTSLYSALHQLRKPTESRTLWADAICINQQDVDERNQQVRLMRQIYETAERVVVWLGQETEHPHLAIDLVPKLVAAGKKRDATGDRRSLVELGVVGLRQVYDLPQRYDDDWKGFFGLLEKPWFDRGWVIQEAAVATSVVVQCGRFIVPSEDFALALAFLNKIGLAEEYFSPHYACLFAILLTGQAFKKGSHMSLMSLILRHRMAMTTNPRDKIFALCGIASDVGPDALDIQIDYRRSTQDVYRDVTIRLLTKEANLDVLSVPKANGSGEHPSWVPDFNSPVLTSSLIGLEHNIQESSPYQASRNSKCDPKLSADGNFLALSGHIFDTIIQITETQPMEMGDNDAFNLEQMIRDPFLERRRYINWQYVAGLHERRKYVTGESMEDAYWQTLIAGYNPGKENLSARREATKADYQAWSRHSLKHTYLRRLPSPFFEYTLAFTLFLSFLRVLARYLICLPFISAPSAFKAIMGCAANRKLVRTKRGYIGLAGEMAREGDVVLICKGGKIPLVVRKGKGSNGCWMLVGDCYIHGIMGGEAFRQGECETMWFC